MDNYYRIVSGHKLCHPETCCCDDYKIVPEDDKSSGYSSDSGDLEWLQQVCERLNKEYKLNEKGTTMVKYVYERVEHINDMDFSGKTDYYYSAPHEYFDIRECTIKDLKTCIQDRNIYTRKEKPWYKRIPDHGVLCKFNYEVDIDLRVVVEYKDSCVMDNNGEYHDIDFVTPLTDDEIKKFLREE